MFGQSINTALSDVGAEQLTDLAIVVMLALWSMALVLGTIGVCRRFTAQTSTLLTSVGILGTFAGIVVGLYGFDSSPGRIDASVQTLLEGLKTAFTSSLVGMALAVTYKLLATVPLFSRGTKDATPSTTTGLLEALVTATRRQADEMVALRDALGVSPDDTLGDRLAASGRVVESGLDELKKSAQSETRLLKEQCETLGRLHASLVDDDDASLSGQLRQLRGELSDRHRSRRAEADALARLGEAQAESLQHLVDEQRGAATIRSRIEKAVLAAEGATRAGTEALSEGNGTLERLLHAVGDDVPTGVIGQLQEIRVTIEDVGARIDAQTADLGTRADRHGELNSEQLAVLHEQNAGLETLVERIGGSGHDSLNDELRELKAVAENSRELQDSGFERLISSSKSEEGLLADVVELGRTGLDGAARTERMLGERMAEIAGLLSRSPTEEIIEALKTTIREFNEHIAEQFGDNFKQLNEAVGRLLDWQENYRGQLEDMQQQYAASVQAITDTERSVGAISAHSAVIPEHMERLGDVLLANDAELGQLRAHLVAFAEAREQAVQAVPEITRIVADTVGGLSDAGRTLTSGVQTSAETMTGAIQKSAEDYARATDSINEDVRAITHRTHDETLRLFSSLEEAIKETYRLASESTNSLVKQEFSQMETVRDEQTQRVMESMGVALVAITDRFTDDYARLVDAMDRVVRTGRAA